MVIGPTVEPAPQLLFGTDVPVAEADNVRLAVKVPPDALTYLAPLVVERPIVDPNWPTGSPNPSFAEPGCVGPPLLEKAPLAEEDSLSKTSGGVVLSELLSVVQAPSTVMLRRAEVDTLLEDGPPVP